MTKRDGNLPELNRRDALRRLGLAIAAGYAVPTLARISNARASSGGGGSGGGGSGGGGSGGGSGGGGSGSGGSGGGSGRGNSGRGGRGGRGSNGASGGRGRGRRGRNDHEKAYGAYGRGEIQSLSDVMSTVGRRIDGEIVRTRLRRRRGRWIYEFRYLTRSGRYRRLLVDARTKRIVRQ